MRTLLSSLSPRLVYVDLVNLDVLLKVDYTLDLGSMIVPTKTEQHITFVIKNKTFNKTPHIIHD